MDPKTKAALEAANAQADTITDGILLKASQSKWTPWLIVAWTVACCTFGWWLKG